MGRIHEVERVAHAVIDVEEMDRKAVVEWVSRRVDDPRVREQAFDEADVKEIVGPLVRDARRARVQLRQRGEIAIGKRGELLVWEAATDQERRVLIEEAAEARSRRKLTPEARRATSLGERHRRGSAQMNIGRTGDAAAPQQAGRARTSRSADRRSAQPTAVENRAGASAVAACPVRRSVRVEGLVERAARIECLAERETKACLVGRTCAWIGERRLAIIGSSGPDTGSSSRSARGLVHRGRS